jgi:hypothetical protein
VPDGVKDDAVREMEQYLGTMIRQVDSSLLDEWEKMRDPRFRPRETAEVRPPGAEEAERDITRDAKGFLAAIRTRIFTFLRALSIGEHEAALGALSFAEDAEGRPWDAERLRAAHDAYRADHAALRLDPEARNLRHTHLAKPEEEGAWIVQQVLVDPDEHDDWMAEFEVDLEKSRARSEPVMRLRRISPTATV